MPFMRNNIKLLIDLPGNSSGDIIALEAEDERYIHYTDGWDRWCSLLKSEEGTAFKYTAEPPYDD